MGLCRYCNGHLVPSVRLQMRVCAYLVLCSKQFEAVRFGILVHRSLGVRGSAFNLSCVAA